LDGDDFCYAAPVEGRKQTFWGRVPAAAIAKAIVVAIVIYGVLFVISWLSVGSDPVKEVAQVRFAFDTAQLSKNDIEFANSRIGSHQFNDCLILDQVVTRAGSRVQMALTPANDFANRYSGVCQELWATVIGGAHRQTFFYQNYIHGHTIVARVLLNVLSIASVRKLYQFTNYALVFAGICLALFRLARRERVSEAAFWLAMFVIYGRFYGLEFLGQSLGHGPADAVFLSYALWLEIASFNGRSRDCTLPVAIFGALTMAFEFLTGGLPQGLALTVAGIAIAARHNVIRETMTSVIVFSATVTAMIAIKLALTVILFGPDAFASMTNDLAYRMSNSVAHDGQSPMTFEEAARRVASGLGEMVGMSPFFAYMAIVLAVVIGVIAWVQLRETAWRKRALLIAASNLVLIGWVVIFREHFYMHAWFMTRIFTWTIASGFGLFAISLTQPQRRQSPS